MAKETVLVGYWAHLVALAGGVEKLAVICEVSTRTIHRWGTGRTEPPLPMQEFVARRLMENLKARSPWK